MARLFKITISRGEDVSIPFAAKVSDAAGAAAQDITGHTLVFTVSDRANSATKLITKTCSHTLDASGTFSAALLSADTNIDPGSYWADVYRTDSGSVRCLGYGPFNIRAVAYKP